MDRMGYPDACRLVGDLLESEQSGGACAGVDSVSVPGYELVRELGRGSGGVVYAARSVTTDRSVAIKLVHTPLGDRAARAFRELDSLAQIRSPVVPQLLDYGMAQGRLYIVTELIDGRPLLSFAEGLSLRDRAGLLAELAECVSVLHEFGVIHRDLKPSNVMVTESGRPVVIDFGVAGLIDPGFHATLTAEGVPIGTPAYMAPEQARGERSSISTRSDVYALGAIGFVLLAGGTPHALDGTMYATIHAIGSTHARDPSALDPHLPKALASVLRKACAFAPSDRYETAGAFAADLRRWLRREPVQAGGQSAWMRCSRWMGRHPVFSTVLCCTVVAMLILASTVQAVRWLTAMPHGFDMGGKAGINTTTLISRIGNPIQEFKTESEEGIAFGGALLEHGDRTFAVLAFREPEINTGAVGLVGFDTRDLSTPAWVASPRVPDALAYAVGGNTSHLSIVPYTVTCADVFHDEPGLEVIILFRQIANSVGIVQVLSAEGRLMFEVAHDGWLDCVRWNPSSGQLLLGGVCSDGLTTARGATRLAVMKYPLCVLAVTPEPGSLGNVILTPERGPGYEPDWYRVLLPLDAYAVLDDTGAAVLQIKPAPDASEEGRRRSVVTVRPQIAHDAHAIFLLNERGEPAEPVRYSDSWSQEPHLAGLGPLWLGDLPARQEN